LYRREIPPPGSLNFIVILTTRPGHFARARQLMKTSLPISGSEEGGCFCGGFFGDDKRRACGRFKNYTGEPLEPTP